MLISFCGETLSLAIFNRFSQYSCFAGFVWSVLLRP